MLRIVEDAKGGQRLQDTRGRRIGWIRGRTIGFAGFETEEQAIKAAIPAAQVLGDILARAYPGWPHHDPGDRELRVVHDAGFDWIVAGPIPLGRFLRPLADVARAPYAVEFILPSYARVEVIESAARALHTALFSRSLSPRPTPGTPDDHYPTIHFTDEPIRIA